MLCLKSLCLIVLLSPLNPQLLLLAIGYTMLLVFFYSPSPNEDSLLAVVRFCSPVQDGFVHGDLYTRYERNTGTSALSKPAFHDSQSMDEISIFSDFISGIDLT